MTQTRLRAQRWFEERRGITAATLDAFGIEYSGTTDMPEIRMPYPGASKYRKGLEKEGRRFWWDPPEKHGQALFTPPTPAGGPRMILVEGETDTMRLWQDAPEKVKPLVRGLPGTESWKEHFLEDFEEAAIVYVILDNDDPYENAAAAESVERGWRKIRDSLGAARARRVKLPQGVNDLCEFLTMYSWAALDVLLKEATNIELPYKRLTFGGEPKEWDWHVQDFIVQGDIVLLAGPPGVGKSYLALDLAMATLGLRDEWLGMKVNHTGPVLVIDQENPLVTVEHRVAEMGLDEDNPDLHYLWYQDIRLDQNPDALFYYAEVVRPKLVIIDSISRVHFQNENAAEEMNPILNGGIYPLSRRLGATVMILHHMNKSGGVRGSTALPAAADLSVVAEKVDDTDASPNPEVRLVPNKLRNIPPWGLSLVCHQDRDTPGSVRIVRAGVNEGAY